MDFIDTGRLRGTAMGAFNKVLALRIGNVAVDYLRETDPEVFRWAVESGRADFDKLNLQSFLRDYCWVVYSSE